MPRQQKVTDVEQANRDTVAALQPSTVVNYLTQEGDTVPAIVAETLDNGQAWIIPLTGKGWGDPVLLDYLPDGQTPVRDGNGNPTGRFRHGFQQRESSVSPTPTPEPPAPTPVSEPTVGGV